MTLPTLHQVIGEWIYILLMTGAGVGFYLLITKPIDPEN